MKRVVQFITAFLFSMIRLSYSQTIPEKNTLSFSIGASVPVGNFSSTDPSNRLSGYAILGESVNFSFNHKLNKESGLTVMVYGQRNGINTNTMESQLDKSYFFPQAFNAGGPYFQTGGGQEVYYNWTLEKKYWYLESVLLGVTEEFSFEKNNKLSFVAKALVGAAYAQSPTLNGKSVTDTSYSVLYQNGASAFGFSYLFNVGMNYKLSGKLFLMLHALYFGTGQLNFKNITQNIASTNGGLVVPGVYSLSNSYMALIEESSTTEPNKQPFGTINILAGIGFKL
ncbi:MAG TPA: hypothetical protein VGZ90_01900 [Puia sp.]|jgi:hypothetical protein|nr:hypothetical protein [Puia sp.]